MNREIKFRGKRVDNGEWVYGFGVHVYEGDEKHADIYTTEGIFEVDPGTVGQYTGMREKKGVEIYEGDILRNDSEDLFFINWFQPNCEFLSTYLYALRDGDAYETETFDGSWVSSEVIGNIYEHPHLIDGESDGN